MVKETKNEGILVRCNGDEADIIRKVAQKRGKTIKDLVLELVSDDMKRKGETPPILNPKDRNISPLVMEAWKNCHDIFGTFRMGILGRNLMLRGISELNGEEKSLIFNSYLAHVKFWSQNAESIHEHVKDFMVNWKGEGVSDLDVSKLVKEFYDYKLKRSSEDEEEEEGEL